MAFETLPNETRLRDVREKQGRTVKNNWLDVRATVGILAILFLAGGAAVGSRHVFPNQLGRDTKPEVFDEAPQWLQPENFPLVVVGAFAVYIIGWLVWQAAKAAASQQMYSESWRT